jgi:hypothetical protein
MEAAKVLAGYSLGEADLLRRAMGKKIKARWTRSASASSPAARQRHRRPKANELFDLIDKFAGYGFNKSHAAAYALVAYQTAWLKAHHPVEFYAASMCFDMAQTDKLAIFVDDMRRWRSSLPAAVHQRQRGGFSGGAARRGPCRPLRARRAQGRRRKGDGAAGRGARGERRVQVARRFRRAGRSAAPQPPPDREPRRRRRVRRASRRTAPRSSPRPRRSSPTPPARPTRAPAGRAACSAAEQRRADPHAVLSRRAGRWPSGWGRRRKRSASISPPTRSTNYRHLAEAHGAELRRARLACRRRPMAAARRGDGRAGRGSALAHLRQGPALPDGDRVRLVGPVRRHRVRRRRRAQVEEAAKAAAAACSTSSSTGGRARKRRASRSSSDPVVREPVEAHPPPARGRGGGAGRARRAWPPRRRSARRQRPASPAAPAGRRARPRLVLGRDFLLDAELAARIERIGRHFGPPLRRRTAPACAGLLAA